VKNAVEKYVMDVCAFGGEEKLQREKSAMTLCRVSFVKNGLLF
jgi:hypothetical protein